MKRTEADIQAEALFPVSDPGAVTTTESDPFHKACCAVRRWWPCPGEPRLEVLKVYHARNQRLFRLDDEGFAVCEIARQLGVTEGNVRHHLRRGRAWLQMFGEGIVWLSLRVRNARSILREHRGWIPSIQWFKGRQEWRKRFFRQVLLVGQDLELDFPSCRKVN